MNRRLTITLAVAILIASASTQAGFAGAQQTEQGPARTGQKETKAVEVSCPVHPEVKTRTAGKCPKCRMEERKQKSAREKKEKKGQAQGASVVNE